MATTITGSALTTDTINYDTAKNEAGTFTKQSGDENLATTLATEQATTSGTSIDFTGIPSGVKKIVMMFDAVSTSGTSAMQVRIGDSGGIETSGYVGGLGNRTTQVGLSDGFRLVNDTIASNAHYGVITLTLEDAATFTWAATSIFYGASLIQMMAGIKPLSAELTQISLTTSGGTDTFDAGSINIQYSF
jgi:hypothetical protein